MRVYKVVEINKIQDLEPALNDIENDKFRLIYILHDSKLKKFVLVTRSGSQSSVRQAES